MSVDFREASELVAEVASLAELAILLPVELATVLCLELFVYTSTALAEVKASELFEGVGELTVRPARAVPSTEEGCTHLNLIRCLLLLSAGHKEGIGVVLTETIALRGLEWLEASELAVAAGREWLEVLAGV